MIRMLLVVALFGAVALAGSALAQGPGGPGGFGKKKGPPGASGSEGIRRIEDELAQIHQQLDRIEALLKEAHSAERKGGWAKGWEKKGFHGGSKGFAKRGAWARGWERKGFGGPPGFARRGGWAKGWEKKGFGPHGFAKKGFGKKAFEKKEGDRDFEKKKAFGPPAEGRPSSSSIQERLEQIQQEIGELRRVLKKQ